ncbi:PREDICTED: putative actin-depolymerizing factor 11 [Camelina sativa]|uniref:Actin-depolymerizing factor 11 n=1 Tax=Camelina sativa TaxID=90675 RepID=A0ABM0TTA6_CAMSA|nr:PREDICTED: putative actin-depolymerizing factor 11 [Camelina sativa]
MDPRVYPDEEMRISSSVFFTPARSFCDIDRFDLAMLVVHEDCKLKLLALKEQQIYRFIVYKIEDMQVIVENLGEREQSYDDFRASLPADDCRYAIFDFDYAAEGRKTCFIAWSPVIARLRNKMIYASNKDRFTRELDGIQKEYHATIPADMRLDVIRRHIYYNNGEIRVIYLQSRTRRS